MVVKKESSPLRGRKTLQLCSTNPKKEKTDNETTNHLLQSAARRRELIFVFKFSVSTICQSFSTVEPTSSFVFFRWFVDTEKHSRFFFYVAAKREKISISIINSDAIHSEFDNREERKLLRRALKNLLLFDRLLFGNGSAVTSGRRDLVCGNGSRNLMLQRIFRHRRSIVAGMDDGQRYRSVTMQTGRRRRQYHLRMHVMRRRRR